MEAKIVCLGGDGIGPEIVNETKRVLETIAKRFDHRFEFDDQLIGGIAIDTTGNPLPDETIKACESAQAVLLGAVGGPKWDDPKAAVRPEQGLLAIRKALQLFANLRPVRVYAELASASPLKEDRLAGVDMVVVRELTGGIYFGQPRKREALPGGGEKAIDTLEYSDEEVRRVVRLACEIARGRRGLVTSVDKANVLESSRLWRQIATEVGSDYPDIKLEHQLVDSAAMRLVSQPSAFDVVVTENMFGDILTDEAAVITGSLGMLPSASLGAGTRGLYEPIHGSAPDIAGKGIANPLGTVLSSAMMLRHSLGLNAEADALEQAVQAAITDGARTADLGGKLSTREMADAVLARLG